VTLLSLGYTSRDTAAAGGAGGVAPAAAAQALFSASGLDRQVKRFGPRGRVLRDFSVRITSAYSPTTLEKLANLRSVPKGFEKSKCGADIVAAVERGLKRDFATLPKLEKPRNNSNGAAIVELLKVLLRMTSERHAVASKVIATVDDLEQIAADDDAEVAALHGWRRELFGEAALALKHGRLALAIEKGRVVRVERN
jgi:ribonuclease D